jgi:Mn-dependent DtxR family transcriptional regulator
LALRGADWTCTQIGENLGRNESTVRKFLKKFDATGITDRLSGSGRPRATTLIQDERLINHALLNVKRQEYPTAESLRIEAGLFEVSTRTIRRRLLETDKLKNVIPKKKPFISDKNVKRRLEWCLTHRNWSRDDWAKVVWTDESPFHVRFQGRLRRYVPTAKEFKRMETKGTVKHATKIMVWGCFARNGTGVLHRINGIMDQNIYKNILIQQFKPSAQALFPEGNFIFQQDNDPKHTAKTVQAYIRNQEWHVLQWPAQSPDLNPIENLWYILDRETKDRTCKNEEELFLHLQKAWEHINVDILHNLVDSMPRRIQEVIDAKGLHSSY